MTEADTYFAEVIAEELVSLIAEAPNPDKRSLEDFAFGYTEVGHELCAAILDALRKENMLNYDYRFTKLPDGSRKQHTFLQGRFSSKDLLPIAMRVAEQFCREQETA